MPNEDSCQPCQCAAYKPAMKWFNTWDVRPTDPMTERVRTSSECFLRPFDGEQNPGLTSTLFEMTGLLESTFEHGRQYGKAQSIATGLLCDKIKQGESGIRCVNGTNCIGILRGARRTSRGVRRVGMFMCEKRGNYATRTQDPRCMHACLCLDCAEESLIVTGFECVMCKMCLASVGLFGTAKTRARAIHVTKRLRRMRSYMQKIIRCTYMWNLMQFLRHVHVGNIANTAFARMARNLDRVARTDDSSASFTLLRLLNTEEMRAMFYPMIKQLLPGLMEVPRALKDGGLSVLHQLRDGLPISLHGDTRGRVMNDKAYNVLKRTYGDFMLEHRLKFVPNADLVKWLTTSQFELILQDFGAQGQMEEQVQFLAAPPPFEDEPAVPMYYAQSVLGCGNQQEPFEPIETASPLSQEQPSTEKRVAECDLPWDSRQGANIAAYVRRLKADNRPLPTEWFEGDFSEFGTVRYKIFFHGNPSQMYIKCFESFGVPWSVYFYNEDGGLHSTVPLELSAYPRSDLPKW